jgi:hypothetical protein
LPPIELARIIAAASFEMGTAMTRMTRHPRHRSSPVRPPTNDGCPTAITYAADS